MDIFTEIIYSNDNNHVHKADIFKVASLKIFWIKHKNKITKLIMSLNGGWVTIKPMTNEKQTNKQENRLEDDPNAAATSNSQESSPVL